MLKTAKNELHPRVIHLDAAGTDYLPVLGGHPESVSMRSGLVILSPGSSVGVHNTGDHEELIIVFEGQGDLQISGQDSLAISAGVAAYCPPDTEHDVVNTGASPLRYIYVVARTKV